MISHFCKIRSNQPYNTVFIVVLSIFPIVTIFVEKVERAYFWSNSYNNLKIATFSLNKD